MEPARTIIERLGGPAKVAEITGTALTAPYRWQVAVEKGGTGGFIPRKYHRQILDFAGANEIDIAASDFLQLRSTNEAAA